MKTVTVRLTDTAYEKLRAAAFRTRATQNEILATGMQMWIDQYDTPINDEVGDQGDVQP
jgi:uncharacterized FlgJ-related protein